MKKISVDVFPAVYEIGYELINSDTVHIQMNRYGTITKFSCNLNIYNNNQSNPILPDKLPKILETINENNDDMNFFKRENLKNQFNLFSGNLETDTCRICGDEFPIADLTRDNVCTECAEHLQICDNCREEFDDRVETMHEIDNEIYCESCTNDLFLVCDCCDEFVPHNDAIEFNGKIYCQDCIDNIAFRCSECGEYVRNDESIENENGELICQSCFEHYYCICDNCGHVIYTDHAHMVRDTVYCQNCYDNIPENSVHGYSYKPRPIFLVSKNEKKANSKILYFGKEIEIDSGNYSDFLNDYANCEFESQNLCYLKSDGSLSEDGIEIVTNPVSYKFIIENIELYRKLFDTAKIHNYTSHDNGGCGLHIHCNKSFFGDCTDDIESGIANVLFLYEKFWNEISKFSRRKGNFRYCERYNVLDDKYYYDKRDTDIPKKLLNMCKTRDRYKAVNLTNLHTIEFRVFRGTLNIDTFLACVQFTKNIMELSGGFSNEKIFDFTFPDIVHYTEYSELTDYCKFMGIEI